MRISFLLGPAGSGKTFRCLSEIRGELLSSAEGAPLVFIAPKQSTYQLERQLLEEGGLEGYSRLQIVSFERFATFVFNQSGVAAPKFLSEQGRTMVLRALLTEMAGELSVFGSAARRLGFAEEASRQIREFQNHGMSAARVRAVAERVTDGHIAREKLLDLALVYERYVAWLEKQELQDGDALLTAATELLEKNCGTDLEFAGIWVDGFAQLTPQEMKFLVATLRVARRSTLAFCADGGAEPASKISSEYLVSRTVARCRAEIEMRYGEGAVQVEIIPRDAVRSRFGTCEELRHLERCWQSAERMDARVNGAVRVVQTSDPEGEAIFAAREIVRHVKAGGRYREVALLLRDLQNDFSHVLRRVFQRYEIPYFLDHREGVAHHPLAELTRGALRTVAYNFQHHDWFATLKSGLIRAGAEDLDELENESLARGWQGAMWRTGFIAPKHPIIEQRMNRLRERLVAPFLAFGGKVGTRPRAEQLVEAIRGLWETLAVEEQLKAWSQEDSAAAVHSTVWDQMDAWLQDLERAFRGRQMSVNDWLPIIEAGLRNLTVGVVPPVLDQVLIGTADRSRNPDLKTLFVLAVNERVFPAAAARDMLLTEDDRDRLCDTGCTLGDTPAWRLAGEQFYGYIACTRPRERLVLSYARASMGGAQLNPSRFISQVQRLFPQLEVEEFTGVKSVGEVVHRCELASLGCGELDEAGGAKLVMPNQEDVLEPEMAHRLYGDALNISVSSLERFASCPYKFFLEQGLKMKERKEFLLDVREQGSFQHDVLAAFHEELKREGLKWRDLTAAQARERIGRIADEIIPQFKDGLLASSEQNRFTAENYKAGLQDLMAVLVEWFATNSFDPEAVEFGFGGKNALPPWKLELENGRALLLYGRVDRVDLHRVSETEALCVVMDYKSGLKKPQKTLLHHGVQQQLPAYLLAMTRMKEVAAQFGVKKIAAAGCFLLPLSGKQPPKKNRREALEDPEGTKRKGFMHEGLFDVEHVARIDALAPNDQSGQFKYRLTKAGLPWSNSFNALTSDDFDAVLDRSEELIREFGKRIYEGEIAIRPYKHGSETPCGWCDYQPVCRFDPWVQKYNVLRPPAEAEKAEKANK